MAPRSLLTSVVVLVTVVALAVASPPIVSAVRLNLANASLVHSLALPTDAPDRSLGLQTFDSYMAGSNVELPRSSLARARASLGRGNAASAYRQLSTLAHPDALTGFVRGNAAWQTGNAHAAIEDWQESGAYTYFREQVIRELGTHDWQAAARDAEIAASIDPSNATAHLAVAEALSHQSPIPPRTSQELDLALKLTRSNEERSTILSLQGELLAQVGDLGQARQRFSEAISVAPTDARPRTALAMVLTRTDPPERDRAVALLMQVVGDSPWYTAAYRGLADIAEKDGDQAGAEQWLLKGLDANHNNADLLRFLGEFYSRHTQTEKARATLISAMKYEIHPDELKLIATALSELNAP